MNSQCEWVNFKPKNNHTTFPANLEKNLKNNFTVWNKLELIWNTRSKTIFRSNILSHLSSFISSSRGLVYFMCVFLKWRARLDLFNGGTMKISCLLCRVVSVLHLCRKGEKILGGGRVIELVYVINTRSVVFNTAFHPFVEGNADRWLEMAQR